MIVPLHLMVLDPSYPHTISVLSGMNLTVFPPILTIPVSPFAKFTIISPKSSSGL